MDDKARRLVSGDIWDYDPIYIATQEQLIEQRIFNAQTGRYKDYGTEKYTKILDIIRNGYIEDE